MPKFQFHFYDSFPNKNNRSWCLNIYPILQIAHFKHESIELIMGWLFWEFEVRFLLKEKE